MTNNPVKQLIHRGAAIIAIAGFIAMCTMRAGEIPIALFMLTALIVFLLALYDEAE